MKINSTAIDAIPSYKTAFVSIAHLSPADVTNLAALCKNGYFFCHNVCNDESGFIVRFGQVVPEQHEMLDFLVSQYDFTAEFAEFVRVLGDAGFDAAHFDPDMDLIEGQTWYTDNGTKVTPLGYNLELRTDSRDESFFVLPDGDELWVNEFMRMDKDSEMFAYGFHAQASGSAFHSFVISISDCGDFVDVARIQ